MVEHIHLGKWQDWDVYEVRENGVLQPNTLYLKNDKEERYAGFDEMILILMQMQEDEE